mmetsp:Transcript_54268/g.126349  ORF Transcript_54268/g.126349 Transcript_54268/m.126349 type:complete len:410 (+) Transcript_54268:45-1274(+)
MGMEGQTRPPVRKLWNEWLDERDRAPGDVLAEWLVEKTQVGLEGARRALEAAWARAEALHANGGLGLDSVFAPCGERSLRGEFPRRLSADPVAARQLVAAAPADSPQRGLEELTAELFQLQDLNDDGFLQEEELVRLSEKIAELRGDSAGGAIVGAKCRQVFRAKLDPEGRPVPFPIFRQHMLQVLTELRPDEQAQLRMLEQFVAEAQAGRAAFHYESLSGGSKAFARGQLLPDRTLSEDVQSASAESVSSAGQPGGPALTFADRVQSIAQGESFSNRDLAAPVQPKAAETAMRAALMEEVRTEPSRRAAEAGVLLQEAKRSSSSSSVDSFVPVPGSMQPELPFAKGEPLQVWSNSKQLWLDGVVEEAFTSDCRAEGYSVPAGTLKVRSPAGVKWVMADKTAGVLRRKP